MHTVAQKFVAGPTHFGFTDATGLETNGCCSGKALQHLEGAITSGIRSDRGQKPGSQHLLGSRQTAKEIVIGMLGKEGFNLLTVFIQLLLERAQQLAQAQCQLAFGLGDRDRYFELIGLDENGQAFFQRLSSPEPMAMQELPPNDVGPLWLGPQAWGTE